MVAHTLPQGTSLSQPSKPAGSRDCHEEAGGVTCSHKRGISVVFS
jgi:hypothetical protein